MIWYSKFCFSLGVSQRDRQLYGSSQGEDIVEHGLCSTGRRGKAHMSKQRSVRSAVCTQRADKGGVLGQVVFAGRGGVAHALACRFPVDFGQY